MFTCVYVERDNLIKVEPSKFLRREGADVHSDVYISIAQAVFGGSIKAHGVYDDLVLTVSMSTVLLRLLCVKH